MNTVPTLNFLEFIAVDHDMLTTDSLKVATVFGKRHDNLMTAIRALAEQLPLDRLLYFQETVETRPNPSGGAAIQSPAFRITRDGFTLLAMGFTGKKALAFKLAYIDAFNAMAAFVQNQRNGLQYRFLATELEFNGEKRKVSACAREMRIWQDAKPAMLTEMDSLLARMQRSLPLGKP